MNEEKSDYGMVDWDKLQSLAKVLAKKIKESKYEHDIIIGISKGGWAIARLLCDYINGKDIICLDLKQLESYKQVSLSSINLNLLEKKVLMVDDIIDKKSIKAIKYIASLKPDEIKILAIFYIKGTIEPDYYAEEISHKLVIFPWNFIDSVRKIIYKNLDNFRGMNAKRIKSKLKQSFNIDVEEEVIEEILKELWKR
ncbi:MAG: phosphoribosyltransferase [Nitrososphaerales archaeon]